MKKIVLGIMGIVMALSMLVSPVSAASGWQVLGYDSVNLDSSWYASNKVTGKVYTSKDNGNIGVRIPDHGFYAPNQATITPYMKVRVYKYNAGAPGTYIGTATYYPKTQGIKTFSFSVSNYKNAKFYATYQANYKASFRSIILD